MKYKNHTNQYNNTARNNAIMKIDADNPVPKYVQLKGILKEYLGKQYQVGQKIPTEIELMNQFQVSRNTVRQAITELEHEGLLSKEQGRGTFFLGLYPEKQRYDALIGVLTPMSTSIYANVIQGIQKIAYQEHYNIVLGSSDLGPNKELNNLEMLTQKNIDGLIFEPAGGFTRWQDSKSLQFLETLTIPVVLMGWAIDDLEFSYISLDDIEVGFRATRYLINAGHTRIACVQPNDVIPGILRYEGYRKAMTAYGIEYDSPLNRSWSVIRWGGAEQAFPTLIQDYLALEPDARPTAFFFFNDQWTLHGCRAFREAGIKIPDDVSVIGVDNLEFAALADIPLTTVVHPQERLGEWAAEILLDEIKHKGKRTPRQIIVKPAIAIRDSVKFL
jgi:GntR family transcriptional regulator of arabinose operon